MPSPGVSWLDLPAVRRVNAGDAEALRALRLEALRLHPADLTADPAAEAERPPEAWLDLVHRSTGKGTDVNLEFNPNLNLQNSKDPSNPMPNDAVLFHEMTHGLHDQTGTYDGNPQPGWTTQEEQNTISSGSPSEATYLQERGYPWKRADHDSTWVPNP